MHLGSMQRRKQYDHERVGCAETMEKPGFFEKYVFPFVGTGVRTRERGACVDSLRKNFSTLSCALAIEAFVQP